MSSADRTGGIDWPDGFDRTPPEDREPYPGGFRVTQTQAFESIMDELEAMGAYNIEVQTNASHKNRQPHLPYKDASPADPGVVVYFERENRRFAVPCDRWNNLRDNARAIASYLDAKRAIERYGVATVDTELSTQALPSGEEDAIVAGDGTQQQPHEVLGVAADAPDSVVKGAYRELVKEHDPDKGGDSDRYQQIIEAKEAMLS